MTKEEIDFIKELIETIEEKNQKIISLSTLEANKETEKVRDEWNKKLGESEESHDHTRQELNDLVSSLRERGYICEDIKQKYNIVK